MSVIRRGLMWAGRRARGRAGVALTAGGLALVLAGCYGAPTANVIVDCEGNSVRLTTINAIKADTTLTAEQKRQKLRDMCITDEEVITVLLR